MYNALSTFVILYLNPGCRFLFVPEWRPRPFSIKPIVSVCPSFHFFTIPKIRKLIERFSRLFQKKINLRNIYMKNLLRIEEFITTI